MQFTGRLHFSSSSPPFQYQNTSFISSSGTPPPRRPGPTTFCPPDSPYGHLNQASSWLFRSIQSRSNSYSRSSGVFCNIADLHFPCHYVMFVCDYATTTAVRPPKKQPHHSHPETLERNSCFATTPSMRLIFTSVSYVLQRSGGGYLSVLSCAYSDCMKDTKMCRCKSRMHVLPATHQCNLFICTELFLFKSNEL